MSGSTPPSPGRASVRWHRRMEARVAIGVMLIVWLSLGVVLLAATRIVTDRSLARAADELYSAHASFARLLDGRAASAATLTRLVAELPIFRAHLSEQPLANDAATISQMADRYRQQLGAQFCIVTNGRGAWLGSAGWPEREVPEAVAPSISRSTTGTPDRGVVSAGGRLYLVVSEPAMFANEVLGAMTVGFALDDRVARELAAITRYQVVLLSGSQISGSSMEAPLQAELLRELTAQPKDSTSPSVDIRDLGGEQYIAGIFPLTTAQAASHRLVLLRSWSPTQQFIDELDGEFLRAAAIAFALALVVGLVVSRGISQPLKEIAAATADIAAGNWDRRVPLRGSAEAVGMADAFNRMSASLRVAHARLLHDALHDQLTALPNRALFMERLERAVSLTERRPDVLYAVLFIDLDRFKAVNDSLGHAAGDELLTEISRRLAGALRRSDAVARGSVAGELEGPDPTLARIGGDEFTVLVEGIRDPSDAVRVAERIRQTLARPVVVGGQEVFTSASVGIAIGTSHHRSGDDVLRDADIAMYRAKAAGGDQCAVFDATMHERAVRRLQLETELRRALARGEFRLHYQPIVSLPARRLAGFEALLRWQHPEQGLLLPGAFLDVAQDAALMTRIDYWVLAEACREAARWQQGNADLPLWVSVNISASTFGQPDVIRQVERVLQETGLDGRVLKLEITERVAMADAERASGILRDLKALGVRVSLDDFGTGYSSLSYLQRFPVDTLKVDRSFVSGVRDSDECRQIISTIMNLARALKLEVVAEGAETAEQVAFLDTLECGFAQGFYFSKPLAADELQRVLPTRPAA